MLGVGRIIVMSFIDAVRSLVGSCNVISFTFFCRRLDLSRSLSFGSF